MGLMMIKPMPRKKVSVEPVGKDMALYKRVLQVYWYEHRIHTRLEKERPDSSLYDRQHRILQKV